MINLYVIKDMKGDFQTMVYSFPNDEIAKRTIPVIKEQSELIRRYPTDFVFYRVGSFDFESGHIDAENTPVYICDLSFGGVNEDMA